jgi:ABC-type glycerol-3-phosphate transport system permease component
MTGRFADADSIDGAYETARSILPNMFNSFYISFIVAVYNILVGGTAAYAISRFRTRLNKSLYIGFIGSRVLPPMTMIIPLFVIFRKLHMIDTPWVLILSYNIFILPLSIFLLKAYFDNVPVEMEEMGLIDGCTRFQVLLKIVVPVALPGFIAVFIMAMMEGWSEFFYALVLTDQMTLPPVLISFRQMEQVNWNTLAAVAVLAVIPPVIFVLLLQKYIISGLTSGAVKG